MKVYLVENCENAPGRILAVYTTRRDAQRFVAHYHEHCRIISMTAREVFVTEDLEGKS